MESDTSICPICGSSEFASLPDHLNAHSKLDLIQLVLQQARFPASGSGGTGSSNYVESYTGGSRTSTSKPQRNTAAVCEAADVLVTTTLANEEGCNNDGSPQNPFIAQSNHHHHQTRSQWAKKRKPSSSTPGTSNVVARKSAPPPAAFYDASCVADVEEGEERDAVTNLCHEAVSLCSGPDPFSDEPESSSSRLISADSSCEVNESVFQRNVRGTEVLLLNHRFGDNSELSIGQDETLSESHVQEESDNATSQTSIIKYIIDQVSVILFMKDKQDNSTFDLDSTDFS
jgi:hypothetical protein